MISDKQLLEYNLQGLIPGPNESEEAFHERVAYCQHLKEEIAARLGDALPFVKNDLPKSSEVLSPAFHSTQDLYDIAPRWIPLFFSNSRLLPWHGGCAWIFQQTEESPTGAFLQLRRAFRRSDSYLGLYSRQELIAHELCHAGRMCFEEPRFEEILAYRSSSSRWRSWVGAIAQSSWETTTFFLLLCMILSLDLYALYYGLPRLAQSLFWLKLLPVGLIGFGIFRLFSRQRQFAGCLENLTDALQDKRKAFAVIYRLTDTEIVNFSRLLPEKILHAVQQLRDSSLRWRLIHLAYFNRSLS